MPDRSPIEFRLALADAMDSAMHNGIAVVDAQGRSIHVNDAFCRMIDWPREEIVGTRPPFDYWPPEELATIEAAFGLALAGRFPSDGMRLTLMRRDGTRFPAMIRVSPLKMHGAAVGWVASFVDASAIVEAHREVAAGERRLRELTEHLEDVLYVNDVDQGRLVYLSPAFERVWGQPAEAVIADPARFVEAIEPTWRDDVFASYGRQLQGERTTNEYPIRRPDGSRLWIRDQSYPVVEAGRVRRIVGIASDISVLKETEARLQRSLDQLADAETVAGLGHCEVDLIDLTATWSRGGRRLLGLEHDAVVGYRDVLRRVHREDRPRVRSAHRALLRRAEGEAAQQVIELDYRIVTPAGERYVRERARLTRDDEGRPQRAMIVLQDVTDSVRSQRRLATLLQALEQSPGGVVVTDARRVVEYANAAFSRMSGFDRDDIVGRDIDLVRSSSTPASTLDDIRSHRERGLPWEGKVVNVRKDGSERVISLSIAPVRDARGVVTHYVSNEIDITAQEQMTAELEASRHQLEAQVASRTAELAGARARAEAASRAKSEFLANVSHEIRTPMNAIVGLTHLMLDESPRPDQVERLRSIDAAAQQLVSVVSDVLDLSKIEAGRLEIEVIPFDLRSVAESACRVAFPRADEKGLRTSLEIGADVPRRVRGDPVRLGQVLLNLLGNAVKFTPGGSVTLDVRRAAGTGGGGRLRFEVRDTGVGIDDDLLPRLFQPFEQADGTTTRRFGGTGLGLAISRRLVEMMGGRIGVVSTPGEGSCFWFELPCEPVRSDETTDLAASDTLAAQHAEPPEHRLLLVDDNALNRRVAADLLRRRGYAVDEAMGGAQAIAMTASHPYALVLMDLQMPEVDGLQAAQAIRAQPGHAGTPIIAMSGNVQDEDRRRCIDVGMNAFIAKPVRPQTLFAEVARWLARPTP